MIIKSFRWNSERIAFLPQRGFKHDRRQPALQYVPGALQPSPPYHPVSLGILVPHLVFNIVTIKKKYQQNHTLW